MVEGWRTSTHSESTLFSEINNWIIIYTGEEQEREMNSNQQ